MSQERQTWLGLLARANRDYLENIWATYNPGVPIQKLAGPETGLVQLNTQACKASVSFQFGTICPVFGIREPDQDMPISYPLNKGKYNE